MVENRELDGTFRSILFETDAAASAPLVTEPPSCFVNLNLDQIVKTLTDGRGEYELKPYFYTPLTSVDAIRYRHEVFHDLDIDGVREHVTAFAGALRTMRDQWAQANKLHDAHQQEFWLLAASRTYLQAVATFADALKDDPIHSAGMSGFRTYLDAYVHDSAFITLVRESDELVEALDVIGYCFQLNGNKVTVTRYDDEVNYSAQVEDLFEKFRQGDVDSHLVKYNEFLQMNQVEANILALVAQLYPDAFHALDTYIRQHADYLDATIARFDREVQVYLTCIEHARRLSAAGLTFCYPDVSDSKEVHGTEVFDLALAEKLVPVLTGKFVPDKEAVVTNDFELTDRERVIVVTGANQGGKTTFSRTFGQLHYLAALGLPVPGRDAALFLFDQIFTHYEKEEDIHSLRGNLEDELVRIHDILAQASRDSIIIMNEIFTSTTLEDAIMLGTAVMNQIIERDILCVCVTFVDELSTLSDTTVSMVAAVDPEDPSSRTYKLVRKPADGLAYAVAIAEKYHLRYAQLKERIGS